MKELDALAKKKEDSSQQKKLITYDSKGDIIFVKNLRADALPNPVLNPPYKIKIQKIQASKDDIEA